MKFADLLLEDLNLVPDEVDVDDHDWSQEPPDTGITRNYIFVPGNREGRLLRLRRTLRRYNSEFSISTPNEMGICTVSVNAPFHVHERLIGEDLVDGLDFD